MKNLLIFILLLQSAKAGARLALLSFGKFPRTSTTERIDIFLSLMWSYFMIALILLALFRS